MTDTLVRGRPLPPGWVFYEFFATFELRNPWGHTVKAWPKPDNPENARKIIEEANHLAEHPPKEPLLY